MLDTGCTLLNRAFLHKYGTCWNVNSDYQYHQRHWQMLHTCIGLPYLLRDTEFIFFVRDSNDEKSFESFGDYSETLTCHTETFVNHDDFYCENTKWKHWRWCATSNVTHLRDLNTNPGYKKTVMLFCYFCHVEIYKSPVASMSGGADEYHINNISCITEQNKLNL